MLIRIAVLELINICGVKQKVTTRYIPTMMMSRRSLDTDIFPYCTRFAMGAILGPNALMEATVMDC
jgi:hypothetical protein